MRRVVAALFISLDGVVESPDQWQFDHFDEDMAAGMASQISQEDAILLGRTTYQEWSAYWPSVANEPYASHINSVPKYVFSTTLKEVQWGDRDNVTLVRGSLAEAIAEMKRQPGRNIGNGGSPTLVRSLLQEDLLDELTLLVHPVVVGRGKRLFREGDELKRLQLAGSKTTRTGVAMLTYQPAR